MINRDALLGGVWAMAILAVLAAMPADVQAARAPRSRNAQMTEGDFQAKQLLTRAQELLLAGEIDRGVKMLETIVQQFPQSSIRYAAYLELGKYFMGNNEQLKAVNYLRNVKEIERDAQGQELVGDERELYLEAMYTMGVAYFQVRQYGSAFPILRAITNSYPNSVWANQAYYYIGMCHFAQGNWNKAIKALNLVGTFVDPDSPTVQFVEAGRRFYVKVADTDLPVLHRLGRKIEVELTTRNGDKETIECIPLPGSEDIFVGSIPTVLGLAKPGDNSLQVIGGDEITTRYRDTNTVEGKNDVPRESKVRVVSTSALTFTLGDFETRTSNASLGQPVFVVLQDADLDVTNEADEVEVRIVSRYRDEESDDESGGSSIGVDIGRLFSEGREQYKVRDEVTLKLSELGSQPIRTGKFGGQLTLAAHRPDQPFDKTDLELTCALQDEIVATFVDELHIAGDSPRQATAQARVVSEIEAIPRVTQQVVSDPVVAAKKNLVEAEAYLELGRIFKSMGLTKGAKEKATEGLDRVEPIIRSRSPIPSDLTERAFKLKWELYLVQDNFNAAIATCNLFNRMFPESPFVDQALMGIAQIKLEEKDYQQAISVYNRILALPSSGAKAEAQFRIAEATEAQDALSKTKGFSERAIAAYKACAQKYPDSEFAGASLAKLADYYIETKDYSQANDLLDQVFTDYPDAKFLDSMLLKAVMVSYRMNDFEKAYEKCSQLIFEYPDSPFAERAKVILPRIEERVKKAPAAAAG